MKHVFPIIPAASAASVTVVAICILLLAGLLFFAYIAYSSRHVRFEVSPEGLRVVGDVYGRRIPAQDLLLDQTRVLDLTRDKEFGLSMRTNGTGLPGYSAGWFRLKDGEKALAFVTDKSRVAYIPTRRGYSVLVSVADPAGFLEALKENR